MIDFIKLKLPKSHEMAINAALRDVDVFENSDWTCDWDVAMGLKKPHNLDVKFSSEKPAHIANSLHTYYNMVTKNIKTNSDDFTYSNISDAITLLEQTFGENILSHMYFTQLEFGMNIELANIDAATFIEYCVYSYNDKQPYFHECNKNMCIKKFKLNDYEIKFYDKGRESKLGTNNLLRVEVKYKGKQLKKLGVRKLVDFKSNIFLLKGVFSDFMKKVSDVLIIDFVTAEVTKNIPEKDRNKLYTYTSSLYRTMFIPSPTTGKASLCKRTKGRHRKELSDLVCIYKLDSLHKKLIYALTDKFTNLISS